MTEIKRLAMSWKAEGRNIIFYSDTICYLCHGSFYWLDRFVFPLRLQYVLLSICMLTDVVTLLL
jgi:hypothetical protein